MQGSCPWTAVAEARLPEVTNGRFVEAKPERGALSVGQLWRSPTGRYGSRAGSRTLSPVALNLPDATYRHTVDVRQQWAPASSRRL